MGRKESNIQTKKNHRDGSFEHSKLMGKKIITILRLNVLFNWLYVDAYKECVFCKTSRVLFKIVFIFLF